MIDPYTFEERICICLESGMTTQEAERIASKQFFASCNLPTSSEKEQARRIGWSKLKLFRSMNQEGLRQWRDMKTSMR